MNENLFWKKVDKSGECWEWTASLGTGGYGQFVVRTNRKQKRYTSHRLAYQLLVGDIPDGLDLDHLCRNRKCVNPAHLEPVTRRVNLLRGIGVTATKAQQTHCIHGHLFSKENTFIRKNGCRTCLTCRRESDRRRYPRRSKA